MDSEILTEPKRSLCKTIKSMSLDLQKTGKERMESPTASPASLDRNFKAVQETQARDSGEESNMGRGRLGWQIGSHLIQENYHP